MGLQMAGFQVVYANDLSKYACMTLSANFSGTEVKHGDIKKIKNFPNADLLVGCYPCQGFSQGGARDSKRIVNYLYREFDRALRQIKPKAFIVENVSGMLRANNKRLLHNQLCRFRLAGYRVSGPELLDASKYGVAQTRKRIFLVGIRSDLGVRYSFPKPSHGNCTNKRCLTQRDIIWGMPSWPEGEFYDKDFHWYYLSRNRRRDWNQPSATILSNERHMPLHPSSPPLVKHAHNDWRFEYDGPARRLSFREAALLQGFPENFIFPEDGSLSLKYKVIGNAVPPPLFSAVAKALPDIW